MSVTCKPSWRTARAAYWEVVLRGAYVCLLHIKPFFLLVHTRYGWHPRELRGGRAVVEGKTRLTKHEGDCRQVTGDQTDNVLGRTSVYYATPTANCCPCPEDVLLCFGFPVLPFRPWSYSVFSYCCSVLPATSPGGHDTS